MDPFIKSENCFLIHGVFTILSVMFGNGAGICMMLNDMETIEFSVEAVGLKLKTIVVLPIEGKACLI